MSAPETEPSDPARRRALYVGMGAGVAFIGGLGLALGATVIAVVLFVVAVGLLVWAFVGS